MKFAKTIRCFLTRGLPLVLVAYGSGCQIQDGTGYPSSGAGRNPGSSQQDPYFGQGQNFEIFAIHQANPNEGTSTCANVTIGQGVGQATLVSFDTSADQPLSILNFSTIGCPDKYWVSLPNGSTN